MGTGQPKSVRGLVHGASFRLSAWQLRSQSNGLTNHGITRHLGNRRHAYSALDRS